MTDEQKTEEKKLEPAYLGDGVYARFDGFHILLSVNHHLNEVVALEPQVLKALNAYAESINKFYGTKHF